MVREEEMKWYKYEIVIWKKKLRKLSEDRREGKEKTKSYKRQRKEVQLKNYMLE